MKQEDKDLLLKDLCGRLPYGLKIALKNSEAYHHDNVAKIGDTTIDKLKGFDGKYFTIVHDNPLDWSWFISEINIEDIKPYLFPLSSMTEEELNDFYEAIRPVIEAAFDEHKADITEYEGERPITLNDIKTDIVAVDWILKNHFDMNGLIEKGLAINATGLNIY